jgi:hypothetical protein
MYPEELYFESDRRTIPVRALVAAGVCVALVASFKAGHDAATTRDPQAHYDNPISWISAPMADLAHTTGIVSTPEAE